MGKKSSRIKNHDNQICCRDNCIKHLIRPNDQKNHCPVCSANAIMALSQIKKEFETEACPMDDRTQLALIIKKVLGDYEIKRWRHHEKTDLIEEHYYLADMLIEAGYFKK